MVLAVAILAVPTFFGGSPSPEMRLAQEAVEPLKIEVHRAPWYEWALLPGIGEARAKKIVSFVEGRGSLRSLDDLLEIPGLPAGWLEASRPHLSLGDGNPSTQRAAVDE